MAAKHIVICPICHQKFDTNTVETVKYGARRYAHKVCADNEEKLKSQEDKDRESLEAYIMQLFKCDFVSPKNQRLIKQYINEYHYTYSGIKKALFYFFEIKKNSTEKSNDSIGIVPYVYKEAFNYYYTVWEAAQANENKSVETYIPKERVITIVSPQRQNKNKKRFTFFDEDVIE